MLIFVCIFGIVVSGVENYMLVEWVGKFRCCILEGVELGEINEKIGMNMIDVENGVIEVNCIFYIINVIGMINGGV